MMVKRDLRDWYRGEVPPGRASPLQLVMIQSTMFCNINCAYCYLPGRTSKQRFDQELIPVLIEKLDAAGLLVAGEEVTIAWHAGEPLVLPVSWYREAKERIDRCTPAGVRFRHSFQTNGMLVSDEYCAFFKEIDALVGVSIDGPAYLHDQRRVTRDGKGTFERALAGYERLRKAGIPAASISVLSRDSLERADELYDFFKGLGVTEAGFNIEEIEGENKQSSLSHSDMPDKVRTFYRRLIQRAQADPQPLRIRDLEAGKAAAATSLLSNRAGSGENNPLSIVAVDAFGRISTFSPELLQVPGEMDRYTFGDVLTIDFTRLWENERFLAMYEPITRGIEKCREQCAYYGACAGGAPANKLAENGTFDSTETMHCRLSKQAVVDVFDEILSARLSRRQQARNRSLAGKAGEEGSAPKRRLPRAIGNGVPAAGTPAGPGGTAVPVMSRQLAEKLFGAGAPQPTPPAPRAPAVAVAETDEGALFPWFGSVNVFAPRERILVASGTSSAGAASLDGGHYKPGALVPRQDWRACTAGEHAALVAPTRSMSPVNFVALVTLPEETAKLARALGDDALAGNMSSDADEGPSLYPTNEPSRFRDPEREEELARRVHALFAEDGSASRSLGMLVHRSGAITKTFDSKDGLLLGLHLDTWFKSDPGERVLANNRIAVNLGPTPRRLLLMDVGLDQLVRLYADEPDALTRGASDIGREFMWRNPNYPVLSIEVGPGEAYIAATENIIHDASTHDMPNRDVMITLLGRFTREKALARVRMNQEETVFA